MIWVDYLVLLVSFLLIISVLLQNSKDDIKDAFSGEKSELFKNQKSRGIEVILNRATVVLALVFVALVFVSLSINRFPLNL
ncbi:MAG: preprotein translocase subunit SecG [Erysipelotrichales bacterium]|nr:preprotein translocase subunit SecG [Erysipelotrichales bacterium]